MSLTIPCPNCGDRPVEEYHYGGEVPVGVTRGADDVVERAWMVTNAEGPTTERWFHDAGCRRWLTLVRDTTTDRIGNRDER